VAVTITLGVLHLNTAGGETTATIVAFHYFETLTKKKKKK